MKIHSIALKDFTHYEATVLDLEDTISIIVGENAAGKTSVVDAVTFCLTGHCDRTDRAGRGAEAMVRTGAKEAMAGLRIGKAWEAGPHMLTRKIPGGLKIDGAEGGQKELQDYLYEVLGASDGAVTAALNTHAFLDLPPAEQKGLLFGLLGLELTPGAVMDMIIKEAAEITGRDATVRLLEATPRKLYEGGPAEVFAKLYKHFYDLRRDAKRKLKDLGEQPRLTAVPDTGEKDKLLGEVEGLEQLLYEVRSRADQAGKADEYRSRLEAEIAALQKDLETATDTKAAQAQLESVREELVGLRRDRDVAASKAASYLEAAEAFREAGAKECLGAPGIVTCPLTKPKRQDLVKELTLKEQEFAEKAAEASDAIGLLEPRRQELEVMANAPDRPTLEGMISERQKQLDELSEPVDTTKAKAEIADLEARIAERRAALEDITRAEGAREAVERQASERDRLSEEVDVLEVLVKLTSPQGIPGRLLGETIGPLQDLANERLLQLTGGRYQLVFSMEPDFNIVVTHDDVESDLKRLSSSERMRIGVIIQDAISRLSGLRMMVIDNADILDPHNRMLLTETLLTIKDDYDTIIVLSTGDPAAVTDPEIEDVAVYRLVDGQFERVREGAMVS